ncbi:MAG: hypothetical protein P1V36_08520 [Planctomycetota bacterium]|nr:hypothetical protein [Planctomycetota bacterium]
MTADPVIVVVPPVEITEATLPAFERELMGYLDGHAGGLVVDLASVGFISSAGAAAWRLREPRARPNTRLRSLGWIA